MSRLQDTLRLIDYGQQNFPQDFQPLRLGNDLLIKPIVFSMSRQFGVNQDTIDVADKIFEGVYQAGKLDPLAALSNFKRAYTLYHEKNAFAESEKKRIDAINKANHDERYKRVVKQYKEQKDPSTYRLDSDMPPSTTRAQSIPEEKKKQLASKDNSDLSSNDQRLRKIMLATDAELERPLPPRTEEQFNSNLMKRKQKDLVTI